MNTDTIKQQTDLIRLAEAAGAQFHRAGRVMQSACPIHGGDNPQAFTVYTGKDGFQHYKCFTSSECNQFGSDAIAFYRSLHGVDFKTAFQALGGGAAAPVVSARRVVTKPQPADLPGPEWQRLAWQVVEAGIDWLNPANPEGRPGRAFLEKRGIDLYLALAYRFGYGYYLTRTGRTLPAIIMPWWDVQNGEEVITAISYRLLNPIVTHSEGGKQRVTKMLSLPGSRRILFGLNYATPALHDTLLLIEGEFNSLACIQAELPGVSVVSFGSESTGHADILRYVARPYPRLAIWADKPEVGEKLRAAIGREVLLIHSEADPDGVKLDANELLKRGALADCLERTVSNA